MKSIESQSKKLKTWLILWTGFSCPKAIEQQRGDNLHFNTKSSVVPGTHLIYLRRMKG